MQMAKQIPPALIVSDFMFPAGGGATFFQRMCMAASTQATPIIILSSVPKELIAAAVGSDVNAYEHFSNPVAAVVRAYDALKTGGLLVVAVPNYDSWQARARWRRCWRATASA